jgi:hypothetical protein
MRHWAAEVGNWRNDLLQHVTPSMRARIDLDLLWNRALRQADLDLAERGRPDARERIRQNLDHDRCPISLDDLCKEAAEFSHLVMRVGEAATARPRRR